MFDLNIFGNPEPLSIYVAKVDGSILGCIDDMIDAGSASMSIGLNRQYELSFTVTHCDGMKDWYSYIHEGIYLLIEKVGLFKTNQPAITNDGTKETKTVTAYSCDCELEDKTVTVSINTGKEDSAEYLVQYVDGETEVLVNPYTGLPYDWIVLYNMFPEQLASVKTKVTSGYYGTLDTYQNYEVTDSAKITELVNLFDLIPRLKNKIVPPANTSSSAESDSSSGTTAEVITDSTIYEYVTFVHSSEDGSITKILLAPTFVGRIDELIAYYTRYRNQLSLLSIILEETGGWSVGDIYGVSDGDYSIVNSKWQFEIDESIYSFLTNTLAKATNSVITFNLLQRKINVIPIEHLGSDTGIVIGYDTLVNTLDINTDEERLTTRLKVSGGDSLSIKAVNYGSDYIADISYKINAVGEDGNRIYVSDSLATRYTNDYLPYVETRRQYLVLYAKLYEETLEKIDELNNRLPNDSLKTDWGTFSLDELNAALITQKNLLATLTALYKEDYGTLGLDGSGNINENYIVNTPYWWDYVAYRDTIKEIECAIDVFPYYSDQTKWTSAQIQEYKSAISAWETNWSLFGIVELRAKIKTYQQNMDVLAEEAVIRVSPDSNEIKTWANLSDAEKASYGSGQDAYKYDLYMGYYNNQQSAQTYLNTLLSELLQLETAMDSYKSRIENYMKVTSLSNWFPTAECDIIKRLYRDSSYENENIFVTSISTASEKIDKMLELLEDAKEQASICSRPQVTFSTDVENLLAMQAFKPFWDSFIPGNYVMVQYKDNSFAKLRLIGFTFNPCLPSAKDLSVEFSNFIRAKSSYKDWASILGNGSSTGSSGGSGSSSSGEFGSSDKIDVTISNTMLSKLLNTESFGAKVREIAADTITVDSINAKRATFTGLANGTTKIDGGCVQTGVIKSENYNGVDNEFDNTAGSILKLNDGTFSFGGGKLLFDGTNLTTKGDIESYGGKIGGWDIDSSSIKKIISNSESTIPYDMITKIDSDRSRFISYVATRNENNLNIIDTACVGQTSISNINDEESPRISIETTSQLKDFSGNVLCADGYNMTGDEFYRLHLDYINSLVTYVFKEYESVLSGVTTINKEYDWLAYYLFNKGVAIKIGAGETLTINGGNVAMNGGATVPTRTAGDNSFHVANTAYVKTEAENIFDSKIKFIDAEATIDPSVSIASGSVEIITADFSSSVPNGYKIRCAIWLNATSYGYLAPTAVNVLNNTSVKLRVRNFDTSSRTLSNINMTLICVPV